MALSRDELLAAKPRIEKVDVLGDCAYVREMTTDERSDWEIGQYLINGKDVTANRRQLCSRLLVRCVCDENGVRLFADNDLAAVGGIGAGTADCLFAVAKRVNRLSAEDVDDLEKNSVAGPAGNSS